MVIDWKSRCWETKAQRFEGAARTGGPQSPQRWEARPANPIPYTVPPQSAP